MLALQTPRARRSRRIDSGLSPGDRVGTSSLRRQAQLKMMRPDLRVEPLRGNVNTRLAKLDNGDYDAIILAAAGLERLEFGDRISQVFAPGEMLPAAAQDSENIGTLVKITPKKGHDDELIEAITDYHKWIANFEGHMEFTWYEVLTGDETFLGDDFDAAVGSTRGTGIVVTIDVGR